MSISFEVHHGYVHVRVNLLFPSQAEADATAKLVAAELKGAETVAEIFMRNAVSVTRCDDFVTGPEWRVAARYSFKLK